MSQATALGAKMCQDTFFFIIGNHKEFPITRKKAAVQVSPLCIRICGYVCPARREELCRIQQGFKKAVDEEVKNERMKTELVTNVSHDLRTPLTAIITYTDLLKNETDPEKQKEYIEVLERKSFRLKVLIEDLFEISKAASKSVKMNYMQVDLVGLIRQFPAELQLCILDLRIIFQLHLPDHKVIMWLDSEKTYRIFENLIVNITKYAMAQTRVYIEMLTLSENSFISI